MMKDKLTIDTDTKGNIFYWKKVGDGWMRHNPNGPANIWKMDGRMDYWLNDIMYFHTHDQPDRMLRGLLKWLNAREGENDR